MRWSSHTLAYEEVSTSDVLRPLVVLGIISKVTGTSIINTKRDRSGIAQTDLLGEAKCFLVF